MNLNNQVWELVPKHIDQLNTQNFPLTCKYSRMINSDINWSCMCACYHVSLSGKVWVWSTSIIPWSLIISKHDYFLSLLFLILIIPCQNSIISKHYYYLFLSWSFQNLIISKLDYFLSWLFPNLITSNLDHFQNW